LINGINTLIPLFIGFPHNPMKDGILLCKFQIQIQIQNFMAWCLEELNEL